MTTPIPPAWRVQVQDYTGTLGCQPETRPPLWLAEDPRIPAPVREAFDALNAANGALVKAREEERAALLAIRAHDDALGRVRLGGEPPKTNREELVILHAQAESSVREAIAPARSAALAYGTAYRDNLDDVRAVAARAALEADAEAVEAYKRFREALLRREDAYSQTTPGEPHWRAHPRRVTGGQPVDVYVRSNLDVLADVFPREHLAELAESYAPTSTRPASRRGRGGAA